MRPLMRIVFLLFAVTTSAWSANATNSLLLNATYDSLLTNVMQRISVVNDTISPLNASPWTSDPELLGTNLYISRSGGPVNAINRAVSLSTSSLSQFFATVIGMEPLCVAYNVQNSSIKLSVTLQALSDIIDGVPSGQVREVTSSSTTTAYANSSAFQTFLPSASSFDGGQVRAFLASMAAGGVASMVNAVDYSNAALANSAVSVVASEALVVSSVAASLTPTLGLIGLAAAVNAGLPCLRVVVQQQSTTSIFTAAMSRTALPLYKVNTSSLIAVVSSTSALCYPLMMPIIAFVNSSAICSISSVDNSATVIMAEVLRIVDSLATDAASSSFFQSNLAILSTTAMYMVMQQTRVALSSCSYGTSSTIWVAAGGSSALQPVIVPWLLKYREVFASTATVEFNNGFVTYNPAGSGFGLSAAVSGAVVMGGSEEPFTDALLAQRSSLINVPVIGLTIALIFRFPDTCAQLLLPRCAIPLIFSGNVTMWDDERIAAANPLLTLPHAAIQVVVRSDSSGSTSVLTNGLAALEAACSIPNPIFRESTTWVFGSHVTLVTSAAQSSFVRTTPYALSYIVYPTAIQDGHQIASVFDTDSQVTTTALVSSSKLASFAVVNKTTLEVTFSTSATFYPFVGVSYALLDANRPRNCSEFAYIANFLLWTINNPIPLALADDLNYISVPSSLSDLVTTVLQDRLSCAGNLLFPKPVEENHIAAIVAGVVVPTVLLLVAMFVWLTFFAGKRNNSSAPKDASKPVAMAFTDIQASTTLWASVPTVMARALDLHNSILRECLARNSGYEVKTIGDAFMIAFSSVEDAVRFALDAQKELYDANWETEDIDAVYEDMADDKGITTIPELWNGLRVRIGVHCGLLDIHLDPVTLGYDYHGTVVNTTARVEDAGHGGQVVVTQDVMDALPSDFLSLHRVDVKEIGATELRGLPQPVVLTQLLPEAFAARSFPPLRVEKESALLEDDDDDVTDNGTERSNQTAHINTMLLKVFPVAATVDVLFSAMTSGDALPIVRKISQSWGLHVSKKATDVNVFYRRLAVRCSEVLSVRSDRMRRGSRLTATDTNSVMSAASKKVDKLFTKVAAKYEFVEEISEGSDHGLHRPHKT